MDIRNHWRVNTTHLSLTLSTHMGERVGGRQYFVLLRSIYLLSFTKEPTVQFGAKTCTSSPLPIKIVFSPESELFTINMPAHKSHYFPLGRGFIIFTQWSYFIVSINLPFPDFPPSPLVVLLYPLLFIFLLVHIFPHPLCLSQIPYPRKC